MHAGVNLLEVHRQGLYFTRGSRVNIGLRCQASWAKRQATSGLATAAKQVTFREGAVADVKGIQKMVLAER